MLNIIRVAISYATLSITIFSLNAIIPTQAMGAEKTLPPGIVSKKPAKSFVEHVAKINASPAFEKALAKLPDHGPTINLNLLRYRPRGDASRYGLYGAVAGKEIVGVGGDIILHAEAINNLEKISR